MMNIFRKIKVFWHNCQQTIPLYQQYKSFDLQTEKNLRKLVEVATKIEAIWVETKDNNKYILFSPLVNYFLSPIIKHKFQWLDSIHIAEDSVAKANKIFDDIEDNPWEIASLSEAINLYKKANDILFDRNYMITEQSLREIFKTRQKFINFYQQAKEKGKQGFYQEGLTYLLEANKLFQPQRLTIKIAEFQEKINLEKEYNQNLKKIKSFAQQGNFILAQSQLKLSLEKFSRQDGEELKQKLDTIINAKNEYRQGLLAEKIDNLSLAKKQYKLALSHLPNLDSANYRLAIIYIKENDYSSALSCLEKLAGENVNYLRGFCYLQKNNWQNATKEWRKINHPLVNQQKEDLKTLIQRNRLQIIQQIENLVKEEKYQEAKNCCQDFTEKYGYDSNLNDNLVKHIEPALQRQLWQSFDLVTIINQLEKEFKQNPTITNLHNISIALYYQAQIDENYLEKWISFGMTALVNIKQNPILDNLLWLNSSQINYEITSQELIKKIEMMIDKYKDINIEKYYRLRDIFRREILALELIGNPPHNGVKIKEIFITPSLYQQYKNQLKNITLQKNNLGMLFTDWGLAVSACLKNDVERGIKIKPNLTPSSEVEKFASQLMNYHEGCYHLQNNSWKKAKTYLQNAESEIKNNYDWVTEINRLCEKQRENIEDFKEHLQFAQFWYNLLKSSQSASYLAEYKAREISQQVADEKITLSQGMNQLKEVQKIDKNNPLVIDLMSRIEYDLEAEEVAQLMAEERFNEVIRKLKYSSNDELKYKVASIFLEVVIKGVNQGYLTYEEKQALKEIADWAYQICPYESDFIEIYEALDII